MRRFLIKIFLIALPMFVAVILILYFNLSVEPELTGDLGMLGKIRFGAISPDSTGLKGYMVKDQYADEIRKVPSIFSIGDSFSQRGMEGYQNYMAFDLDTTLINIKFGKDGDPLYGDYAEQYAIALLNTGFFDSIPNSTLIIQTGERYLTYRLKNLDFNATFKKPNHRNMPQSKMTWQKYFIDWIKIQSGLADNPVKSEKLSKELFTHPQYASTLFFYYEDLDVLDIPQSMAEEMEYKLKKLYNLFKHKNINLLFVIVPDKYEVYHPYLINNPYREKRLGEKLNKISEKYDWIIFPLNEIRSKLESGEKDIYLVNDTHWSSKGAKILASKIKLVYLQSFQNTNIRLIDSM